MPTYQYRCTECGRDLEVVQKFSDPSLTVCPTCSGALRKVFNAVGVVFKGSGFYRTDSRAGTNGEAKGSDGTGSESGDKSGDKPAEKSSEKKSEAPAAAKSESSTNGSGSASTNGSGSTSSSGAATTKTGSSTGSATAAR